ncbi:GtrA family protein [Undibacterium jejuense]|uniref:GtrA family protein n=1 Tax=Undibacterium jejuense TaxID=1344949 RepID=A0A923HJP0_9BURK|nr:GtrA family protein [Undibacterium jejuense]MBC3864295.1 GtrA family protein [Undibacterium jejuense]
MRITIIYTGLALIATLTNLLAQMLSRFLYNGKHNVLVSLICGSVAGLLLKYWLDKRHIFRVQTHNVLQNVTSFSLYTLSGLMTTVLFWSSELLAAHFLRTTAFIYAIGAIALLIGYTIKYRLDRKFVFSQRAQQC